MYQEMQVYMQQAQRNERLIMQQQQIEIDSLKQSEQMKLKALGNQDWKRYELAEGGAEWQLLP